MVSGKGNIRRDEVQVDRTRLQPDRASQQRRLTRTLTLSSRLQPGGLAVLLLFDVLADVYVLHHGADALSHCLVVQVAVSHANDTRLRAGEERKNDRLKYQTLTM